MTIDKLIKKLRRKTSQLLKDVDTLIGENYHSEAEYASNQIDYLNLVIADLKKIQSGK